MTRKSLLQYGAVTAVASFVGIPRAAFADGTRSGLAADGITDDTAALRKVLATGQPFDGRGRRFAIYGNLEIGGRFGGLRNAVLVQKRPIGPGRRTLRIVDSSGFALENVHIERGGDGSEVRQRTSILDECGMNIVRCHDFALDRVSVTGGGIGSGILVVNSKKFTATGLRAHDIRYALDAFPSDDCIHGIAFLICNDFTCENAAVKGLGGTDGKTYQTHFTRGIALGGCSGFQIVRPSVSDVGQGLDITGDVPGNHDFEVTGGVIEDCATWGYKFANTARRGTVRDAIARRCGIGGFVVSPSAYSVANPSQSITFERCLAEDINDSFRKGLSFGFGVIGGPRHPPDFPRDIHFRHCAALANAPGASMQVGFENQVPDWLTAGLPNTVTGCAVSGALKADFVGFGAVE